MDVRLWRRSATLSMSVVAATHRHDTVQRLFLEVVHDGATGFGEVTPLARALTPDPALGDVVAHVTETAVPRLAGFVSREGGLPEWSRVRLWCGGSSASSWSAALLEMSLLDWSLAHAHASLASAWMVPAGNHPVLATTSLIAVDRAWRPPANAVGVRAKVDATTDPDEAVGTATSWGRPVIWDFNGRGTDEAVRALAAACADRVLVVAVEQPFAAGDLASHALLARDLSVPLSLDESVTSPSRVRLIARHGAAAMVCVKPPRVGGLAIARATIAEARACGLRYYVGGFFESPLARRTHAALARCEGADPSDVAPVDATEDGVDESRPHGLGTVPDLRDAALLQAWEID